MLSQAPKSLSQPGFWLLAMGAGLIAIHLTLVSRSGAEELFGTSLLYWVAIAALVWPRREQLTLESSPFATLTGAMLISLVLVKSQLAAGNIDASLRLVPLFSALGLGLIASGFRGLKQYWQELLLLCFLIPHAGILSNLYDLSEATAWFAATFLAYLGVDATSDGVIIALPKGFVGVNPSCSGYSSMMQLLAISIIFLFMFTIPRVQRFIVPLVAVSIAFIMNSIRVAIMAVLAVQADRDGFLYWHDQEGSLLFSIISVSLFGLFCFFLVQQEQPSDEEQDGEL